jgi:hypothetical protein
MFPPKPDDHILLVDPVVARDHRDAAIAAACLVKRIVFGAQANADARRRFAPRYLTNALRNAPAVVAGSDLRSLTDFYRGLPAVIAAAGPSLDCALDDLRELSDRAVLIGVDTALRPLLDFGLTPALAIGMDPSAKNARHFRSLSGCSETWLVAETALDPIAAEAFEDRTFWFRVADHHPWPWFRELGLDVGRIDVWGSVLTAAFQVAILAGCDPIVLVGADLACTDGRPYARGTSYEFDWAYSTALGTDLEHAWRMQVRMFEQLRVPDLRGVETITTPPLQAFRDWMVAQAGRCGRRVVNATGAGILFGQGIEQSSLHAALPARREIPSLRNAVRREPCGVPRSTLAAHFRDVQAKLADPSIPPLAHWAEFSGDGFDLTAVAAALDAAAVAFDAADSVVDSSRGLVSHSQPTGLLRRLPEAIARLAAALNEAGPLPGLDLPNRGPDELTTLRHALDLLDPLRRVLAGFVEDAAAPLARQSAGRTPVSGVCAWPTEIAWPMQIFEGLLGKVWPESWPAADRSFFSKDVIGRVSHAGTGATDAVAPRVNDLANAGDRLALEWLTCASLLHGWPTAACARFRGLLRAAQLDAQSTSAAAEADLEDVVVLPTIINDGSRTVDVRVRADRASLARVLTGRVAQTSDRRGASRASLLLTPRVLTDEGAARSILGYSMSGGAVFVPLLGLESVLVRHDGSMEPHRSWPRPIVGELPFGIDGAVAWNNWPETGPSYVMHRAAAGDSPVIHDLPFKPTIGAWWGSRLYWNALPSGIGSWAPGEDSAFSFSDLALLSIHSDETGLVLAPCVRDEWGSPRRQRFVEGWRWRPGAELEPIPLGLSGATSSRSSHGRWTAFAHPDADVVQLVSDRGTRISMTCYYPFTVAWAGGSLLVATIEGELLLFENLAVELERWVQSVTGL